MKPETGQNSQVSKPATIADHHSLPSAEQKKAKFYISFLKESVEIMSQIMSHHVQKGEILKATTPGERSEMVIQAYRQAHVVGNGKVSRSKNIEGFKRIRSSQCNS